MNLPLLLQMDESDRRSLLVAVVILLILFFLFALVGMLVRWVFTHQAERAEGFINNVVRAHVLNTPKEVRRFGFKKNNRALFRDSLLPFAVLILALIIWIIENLATKNWGASIFGDFGDLFFWFNWGADGVIVKFFGIPIIASFPPVSHYPEFHVEHLCHYIEAFLILISAGWYLLVCQGYVARMNRIDTLSRSIFKSNLENFHANEDIHVTPDKPVPPSE